MTVGVAVVELHVHGSQSLKHKRGVVRSLSRRVRNRFNCSIAEVGGQDTWQRVVLGITVAGTSESPVRGVLERVLAFIERTHLAEVTGCEVDCLSLPLDESVWAGAESLEDESGESEE